MVITFGEQVILHHFDTYETDNSAVSCVGKGSVICTLDQSQGIVVHCYQSQKGYRGAVLPGLQISLMVFTLEHIVK